MPELPESVPKVPFVAACVLLFLGCITLAFGGGNGLIMSLGALLVLASCAIGGKIGLPELPESVPKGLFVAACVLLFLGFVAIVLAGGNGLIMWLGALLVLASCAIGAKLGLDLWRATE